MALTVTQPFADYQVGDVIALDTDIEKILASDNAPFVVRTAAPDPAPPEVAPKTA